MSTLMLAPPLGAFIGFVGGGYIAQTYDWRFTFLVAAVPGAILALVAWFVIAEPPRGQHDPGASDDVPSLLMVLKRILGLASARHLLIGSTIAAMLGFGINYFFTSLMIRNFGIGIGEAGMYSGLIASAPAALSVMASGWLGGGGCGKTPVNEVRIPLNPSESTHHMKEGVARCAAAMFPRASLEDSTLMPSRNIVSNVFASPVNGCPGMRMILAMVPCAMASMCSYSKVSSEVAARVGTKDAVTTTLVPLGCSG